MPPVPPSPRISAVAAVNPTPTSSEPTNVSAGPFMRLMMSTTGMPAAAKRSRSSAIAMSSVGLRRTASGRRASASLTSAFCWPTWSGVSGT